MAREFLGGPLVKTPQGLKISQATARPKEKKTKRQILFGDYNGDLKYLCIPSL